ncbi:MAG: ferrous iron transporter B, partial [Propionibacteriaceae bacterium]|nr:ferrous iron transporter B [Propionibacteriaceae bacterium]
MVVALAGAPNVGKSTLFNALTGAHVTMGNWPGTSVEYARGQWHLEQTLVSVVDLLGAYSLDALSADEQLTADVLLGSPGPTVTVVIVDGAHLARSLYLVAQLREHLVKLVVAVTMTDIAGRHGLAIDVAALGRALGVPTVAVSPRQRAGLDDLAAAVHLAIETPAVPPRDLSVFDDDLALEDDRFAWIEQAVVAATSPTGRRRVDIGDRVDHFVTGPITGPVVFLAAMWAVFQATTTVAAPLQELLGAFFAGPLSRWVVGALEAFGAGGGWLQGLLVDGLIAGVGTLLSFVPLMAIMFVLLALLEDSGYLARAAVVTDTVMKRLGLPGQAFLPLVVGFGCNVPAIAATRILPQARQRLLTALLVPFTSCSARLSVYLLLGSAFFGRWAGTVVFAMYVLSILLVVCVGLALRHTLWRTMPDAPLILDLPPYQRPTFALTMATTWQRLKGFLTTASGIIVGVVVVVWLLQSIPIGVGAGSFGEVAPADSLFAVLARAITPVFHWTGFGAWQLVSALIIGFVAKEAVISSMGQTFGSENSLSDSLHHVFGVASGGHQMAAVAAFLVFALAYTP